MANTFTFLGTGASTGIPVISCQCSSCLSAHDNPEQHRLRCAIYLTIGDTKLLIDTPPDLHIQAIRNNITQVDFVAYTHTHLDHITGFDELRAFCWQRTTPLPIYGSRDTLAELKKIFPWAFQTKKIQKGYIHAQAIVLEQTTNFTDFQLTALPVTHGTITTQGYLVTNHLNNKKLAYIPDVKVIEQDVLLQLRGVDILIIDALRQKPHHSHISLQEALQYIAKIKPKQCWLTHCSHEMDLSAAKKVLPEHVKFASDNLQITW